MTWQMIRLELIHLSFTIQNLPLLHIGNDQNPVKSQEISIDFLIHPGVQPHWQLVVPATRLWNDDAKVGSNWF